MSDFNIQTVCGKYGIGIIKFRPITQLEQKDLQILEDLLFVLETLTALEQVALKTEQLSSEAKAILRKCKADTILFQKRAGLPPILFKSTVNLTFERALAAIDKKGEKLSADKQLLSQILAILRETFVSLQEVKRRVVNYADIESAINEPSFLRRTIKALNKSASDLKIQLSLQTRTRLENASPEQIVEFIKDFCREISPLPKPGEWKP